MPGYEFHWTRGNFSEGFSSFARYLGLQPNEAIFANSLVVNPEGKSWRLTSLSATEGILYGSVAGMSGPGSTALVFAMSKSELEYCQEYLEEGGELAQIQRLGDRRYYPDTSIPKTLLADESNSARTRALLEGKVFVNSYITEELEGLAERYGGRTLLSCDAYLKFVGKDYLHKAADETGIHVPPGIVIDEPAPSSAIIDSFRQALQNKGIDPDRIKVYIKPSSMSGGQGIISVPNGEPESLRDGLLQLAKLFHQVLFYPRSVKVSDLTLEDPFKEISKFMPIVLEADVGQLPWAKKKRDEVGVNAVLGPKGIVHIETAPFSAVGGAYSGTRIRTPEDEPLVCAAEVSVDKLMTKMWNEGYRGYLGVDTIVVETKDGDLVPYMNDLNARMCGGTPLIGMIHKVQSKLGYRPLGFIKGTKIRIPENMTDPFDVITEELGEHLYRGAETGYTGIVPIIVDLPPDTGYIYFRAVTIARDDAHLSMFRNALESMDRFEGSAAH